MIASTYPYFVLYNEGFIRLAHSEYALEEGEIDYFGHLTNSSLGEKHPDFKNFKGSLGMTMANFKTYSSKNYKKFDYNKMQDQIKKILTLAFKTI